MKMTLSQLFNRLESLTSKLNIELELPDTPAPGTLQEAAKKGGLSGVFGFLARLVDGAQQPKPTDPLAEVVNALSGLLNQQAPPLVAQTVQNGSELLRAAGAKGIDAWTKALAELLPKDEKAAPPSGKDPEVPSDDEKVAQVDTDRAEVLAEPSEPETTALASDSTSYTNSTAIV